MSTKSDEYRVSPETMAELETIVSTSEIEPPLDIFKALADERRLIIMRLLGESELCVCDLTEVLDIDYSKLSYHLKKLKEAALVTADREGNFVTYQPTERGEDVIAIIQRLC